MLRAWRDPEGIAIELAAPELGETVRVAGREARTVKVGNPNVVVFVDDPAREDLVALAAASTKLVGPANVGAVASRGPGALTLRVHERGVGETLACGTGACAAVAAAIARGDVTSDTVRVVLLGGTLEVRPRGEHSTFLWTEQFDLPLGRLGRLGWPLARPAVAAGVRLSLRRFPDFVRTHAG